MRTVVLSGALLAIASVTFRAEAETPAQQAARLFTEANALADVGRYAEACPKLEQSQKLDPGIGTQFNLADCYEHTGRPVASYRAFRQVEVTARSAGKTERADAAHQRAETLEPSLPQLVIAAKNVVGLPRLAVTVDGESVDKASYDHPFPVEAGLHVLEAAAPGKITWVSSVKVEPAGRAEVAVPALADIPPPATRGKPWSAQKTIAVVTGGLGVVGLGVGAVAGIMSIVANGTAKSACGNRSRCSDPAGINDWSNATVDGNVSTVGFIAGGVLVAGAVTLWLTAPYGARSHRSTGSIVVVPSVGPGGGALAAQGTF
jgi:hypothetical protein